MNRTRLIYVLVLALVLLILLGIVVYYLVYGRILADSPYGTEVSRQSKSWDLDSSGQTEKVAVIKYQDGTKNSFVLSVIDSNNKNYNLNLEGFESEIAFCAENELISLDQDKLICLDGYVGAHSQNIQLVVFNGSSLKPVRFVGNETDQSQITSDAPNFGFIDLNGDALQELFVDNRDYDKDPTLDILRSYYYFRDGSFKFDHLDYIHNNEQTNGDGRIN